MMEGSEDNMSILIIQTGGTIDKDYPKKAGTYTFEISLPASRGIVSAAHPSIEVEYRSVFRKDSQDITLEDRELLSRVCETATQSKIVITHGTDTLLETASFLGHKALKKCIVLTGSYRPAVFKYSDADFSVGLALGALQCISTYGVFVAMNSRVFHWSEVARHPETGNFIGKL